MQPRGRARGSRGTGLVLVCGGCGAVCWQLRGWGSNPGERRQPCSQGTPGCHSLCLGEGRAPLLWAIQADVVEAIPSDETRISVACSCASDAVQPRGPERGDRATSARYMGCLMGGRTALELRLQDFVRPRVPRQPRLGPYEETHACRMARAACPRGRLLRARDEHLRACLD